MNVRDRLFISEATTLILPYHIAIDQAREARKARARSVRRAAASAPRTKTRSAAALRVQDLFDAKTFADRLRENLDFHNFVLTQYLGGAAVDFQATLDTMLGYADRLKPMVADVSRRLYDANNAGQNLLFEGAQGTLLDIDHGTYPFVTSSNCVAGAASAGAGVGPQKLNYILGITKAYCTRVGSARSRANCTMRTIRSVRTRLASRSRTSARNSVRSPAVRAAPAGSTQPRCAARSRSTACRACA